MTSRSAIAGARPERPAVLALFDLDGFKAYNDSFGHPAGDALLTRLGHNLAAAVDGAATAYRMGGDEFCLLVTDLDGDAGPIVAAAAAALSERGERFVIGCSAGAVLRARGAGARGRPPRRGGRRRRSTQRT